ncbi:hypothetical protein ABVK25_003376 [Lepraria finkii]|uniref:Separin n=1 Tax=Lepraria finkii TaxID=1340010 RepID=A0ABR4BES8_9LECA
MTRKELPARAANLQRAVTSTTTCTSATVESLHAFLVPAVASLPQPKKKAGAPPPSKKKAPQPAQVKTAGSRARKQPAIAVLEIAGEGSDGVRPRERFELATEVINATLKALTEAIKNPPAQKGRTLLARSSSNASFNSVSNPRSQMPLQPRSANCITNSPGKLSHFRRSSSTASLNQSLGGLRAQAECARIAFAALRSSEGEKGCPALPVFQLESGMAALIEKLIALGFDDLALKELRILRRRLEASREHSPTETNARKPVMEGDAPDANVETLAGMLRFRNIGAKGQTLALIITPQLQTLKILALRQESPAIEAAVQHLQLGVQYSPASLIQRQIDSDTPGSQGRAARQLETLAQALIALCPKISAQYEKSSHQISPETTFRMQVLALQIRLISRRLLGRQSDLAKEMIEPFSQCLSAFNRRSRKGKKDMYEAANNAFQEFQEPVRKMASFREGMFITVYQSLADLAQESSQHSEALRWVQDSMKCATRCGASPTQLCSLYCRSATLQLLTLNLNANDEVLATLKDASSSLRGNLQGESADLDDLLAVVASLRKSAFSVFQESRRSPSASKTQTLSALADECSITVLLCLNFIIRYVGIGSGRDENQKTIGRRQQRIRLASQVATPTVESVVAMTRLCSGVGPEVWARFEAGLRDCLLLISRLEDADPGVRRTPNVDKGSSSSFVSISNAHWYRYLHLKKTAADAKSLRECLRTSIGLVKNRPLCERLAGLLAIKLERYGQLSEESRDYNKAAEAYADTVRAHMHFGLLGIATRAAATRSIPAIWKNNAELEPLSRTLLAYPRVAAKAAGNNHDLKAYFDVEELSADQRGVLLEQQLLSVISRLLEQDPAPALYQTLNELANSLLLLYTENCFPVRRLRIVVRLLALLTTNAHALDNDLQQRLLQEQLEDCSGTHSDLGLQQFLPHLLASRDMFISMRQESPNIKELETVMGSWAQLMQKYPHWDLLETQVYDIADWLLQLDLVAEYLEMNGLELLRVSALHLLATIHEAATSVCCSTLVSNLSALGLQYVRLGYSGLAGSTFHKAQRYLEASIIPSEVTIRWLLSYAEYALVNGNLKSWHANAYQQGKPKQSRRDLWRKPEQPERWKIEI